MGTLIWIFVALVIIGVLGNAINAATSKPTARRSSSMPPPLSGDIFAWPAKDEFEFDVVGESHYQPAIKGLVGDHGDHESSKVFTATIIPEDDNPYDDKAVRVEIDGNLVGYFDRDDARSFRKRLGSKKLTGRTTSCQAMISGGWKAKSGEHMSYGVKLDIKPFW